MVVTNALRRDRAKTIPWSQSDVCEQESYMAPYTRFLYCMRLWSQRRKGEVAPLSWLFYFVAPSYGFYFVVSLLEMWHNMGDLNLMTETFNMLLIFTVSGHKVMLLMWHENEWKQLADIVDRNFNRPQQRRIAEHRAILHHCARRTLILFRVWSVCVLLTLGSLTVLPFAQGIWARKGASRRPAFDGSDASNATHAHSLAQEDEFPSFWGIPYRNWTPFDNWSGIPYWFVYGIHVFTASLQICVVPIFDLFIISLLNFVSAQFRILQSTLINIRRDSIEYLVQTNGLTHLQPKDLLLLGNFDDTIVSPELNSEMERRLGDCVIHHELLLKTVQNIENMVNKMFLSQFFSSSFIFCITGFHLAAGHIGTVKLLTLSLLLSSAMFQLGMLCNASNSVIDESTRVGYAAYCSEWYLSSSRFRRSTSVIIGRARRAAYISFGRFAVLSMETYASIVRLSYTYFTVLNGMNERPVETTA